MAGRIRTIKPEILEHAKTAALSHAAWRAFVSLWLLADDHGNLRADPRQLTGSIFWASRESVDWSDIETELAPHVLFWEAEDGQRYAHIRGWTDHQKVDKPGKPRCPKPPQEALSRDFRDGLAKLSRDSRETLATLSRTDPLSEVSSNSRDSRETLANDLRSPTPTETPTGTVAPARPRAPTRVREAHPDEPEVLRELEAGRDLWPDESLEHAAHRIAWAIADEPTCARAGVTPQIAAREAVIAARTKGARFPERSPKQHLSEAEAEASRWIPKQCRSGERSPVAQRGRRGGLAEDLPSYADRGPQTEAEVLDFVERSLGRKPRGA